MRIAVDLDGVLYQFDKTAQYMMARHSGYELREDLHWDHAQYWRGVDKAEWDWLWDPENVDPLFRHGHLYRGAIEFVQALSQIGDVVVVTKRPKTAETVTQNWIDYHLGWFQTPDGGWRRGVSELHIVDEPKSRVVDTCDFFIDDNPDIVREVLENAKSTFVALMERPWNRHAWEGLAEHERFYLVREFDEFCELVNAAALDFIEVIA